MRPLCRLLAFALAPGFCISAVSTGPTLDQVRSGLHQLSIDPEQTYRVRELQFSRGGVKFYLTEGVLAFATPVCGQRLAAVFTTQMVDAGDAELLTFPPNRAERASLATFAESPNLDEHFTSALMFFGDDTAAELLTKIKSRPLHPAPEFASRLADVGDAALRSNADLVDVRLTGALLDQHRPEHGFFYAMIGARDRGGFNFAYQPDEPDPVTFGRMTPKSQGEVTYFQIWSAFRPKGVADQGPVSTPVSNYQIEATINPDLSMAVDAHFDYAAQESNGRVISLLLTSRLQVQSAMVDGQPAEVCQHATPLSQNRGGAAPFLIVAPEALTPGTRHKVDVKYRGTLIHKTAQGTFFVDDRSAWYPFVSPVRANFDLIFHCPEAFRLVATGEPVAEAVQAGIRTVHRRTGVPEALAGFNLGEYAATTLTHGPYQIEVYANRSMSSSADIPAQTARILDHFTKLWGALPIHSLAVSPIEGYFGQGFPGLIYLSDISYTLEQERPASLRNARLDAFFTQMLLPHEVAHQWWGNIVTPVDYRSNWILEAMSNYVALEYLESISGRSVFEELLGTYRLELVTSNNDGKLVDSHGPVVFGERLLDNYGGSVWHDIVYEKGAWIFHMLRQRLGDERFGELQRRLLRKYAVSPISNEDLRREAAALLPPGAPDQSLTAFFETWIYGTGIPSLSISEQELKVARVDDDFLADIPLSCPAPHGGNPTIRWVHASEGGNPLPLPGCRLPAHVDYLFY